MHTRTPRITLLARLLLTLGCTATGLVSTAHADVQGLDLPVPVAQEPIGRSTGLPPNVLVMLDDSSSMMKRYAPDNLPNKIKNVGVKVPKFMSDPDAWVYVIFKGAGVRTGAASGLLVNGRAWFDADPSRTFPLNTMTFNPSRDYPKLATGEQPPSPGADLPRVKDTPKDLIERRGITVDDGKGGAGGTLRKALTTYMSAHKGGHMGNTEPLPPLYILRHNEQTIKQNYGGANDSRNVENFFAIEFLVNAKTREFDHIELYALENDDDNDAPDQIERDDDDRLTKDYGNHKAWPNDKDFVFTDKDGKVLRRIKPKALFDNYLNFLAFYNRRTDLAQTALAESFAGRDENLRVGFSTINYDSNRPNLWNTTPNVSLSTRPSTLMFPIPVTSDDGLFRGGNRSRFFREVANSEGQGNTPLATALHSAGKYYSDSTSANSPYKGNKVFSCRQNITILTTDGYYNDKITSWGDWDSTQRDLTHTSANGQRYSFQVSAPYRDGSGLAISDTLGDIAMYYWLNDLVPDNDSEAGKNNVPVTGRDPAFWQHMRTYAISFGAAGTLDNTQPAPGLPSSPYRRWTNKPPMTHMTGADDLWHATVNGRGAFYTTDDAQSLVRALRNILDEANPGSGPGSTSAASSYLFLDTDSGNVLQFSSTYNASSLSSNLVACSLERGCKGGAVWSAGARLSELLQGNLGRERNIIFNTGAGARLMPFQWNNLSMAQKQALAGGNDELGRDTVRYLRGDTTLDGQLIAHPDSSDSQNAKWRTRADLGGAGRNVLGMVVHGTPTFIGAPEDIRTELSSTLRDYKEFQRTNKDRPNVLYAAANDGMVHAFITERKTVSVTAGGITTTATFEPGDELFAFIPAAAINKNMRDFTRPPFEYTQHYLLDGELNYSEVKLGNEWKTVLVGSMGAAGAPPNATPAVFALDVTNPGNPKLLWEKTAPAMGQTMGRPVIAPMADGKWSVFIGAGPNQSKTESKSAILQIDLETGNVTTLQGGGMGSANNGGILGLHVVDADRDNYADTIYAGDLAGNVWKVSNVGGKAAGGVQYAKLFHAPQPITAPLTSTVDDKGVRWLFFGTGKALVDADLTDKQSVRTWYGIQDTDAEVKDNELVSREYDVVKIRRTQDADEEDAVVMNYAVAGDMDGKKGWMIPLNQSGDRDHPGYFLLQNRIRNGLLVGQMNFAVDNEPSCDGLTTPSRLMVLDPFTGSVSLDNPNKGNIDVNDDGEVDEKDLYGGSSNLGGGGGAGGGGSLPIVGLGFGSGETSGSILIVQEQRTKGGGNTPGVSDNPNSIESTRTCALDSNGVRVCLPPNPEGQPPTKHSWTELRNDDAP